MIEVECSGVSMQDTVAVLGGAADARDALAVNPEHFIVIGELSTGQRGMEAFGMFGEPVYIHGSDSSETAGIPVGMPFERDLSYPAALFGEALLKSDDTNIHTGAFH